MRICVVTDDNAGFTKQEIKDLGIYVIRMPILINGETYFENISVDEKTFYAEMANDADIKTSQPAPGEIIEMWNNLLKDYDAIIHIPMSSGLSEECNTAKVLAQDYVGKVFVVDNHRISVTLKSSVRDALKLINEGKISQFGKPEEIINHPSCDFVQDFILNQLEIKRRNIMTLFSPVV